MNRELEIILQTTDTSKLHEMMDEAKYVHDMETSLLERVSAEGCSIEVGRLLEKLKSIFPDWFQIGKSIPNRRHYFVIESHDFNSYSRCRFCCQIAILSELIEEWEQCEKKSDQVSAFVEKIKRAVEDEVPNKRLSLRDQLAVKEKTLADIAIHKSKIIMALEKLEVRWRADGSDKG